MTHKLRLSKEKLDSVDDETRQRFTEMEQVRSFLLGLSSGTAHCSHGQSGQKDERTAEELHQELATLRAQLEMNMQTNAGVVEQFRKRQAEIETLTETIAEREDKLQKAESRIQRTRALWEPALRDLVDSIGERFSAAFDRIGCAGEVRIAEHEDYDRWAIDILVKFRDDEKLQLLTAERQSGGVRLLVPCALVKSLTSCAGTLTDYDPIPHEPDLSRTRSLLAGGRDQSGHGRSRRARRAQLARRCNLQGRRGPVLPHYTEAAS